MVSEDVFQRSRLIRMLHETAEQVKRYEDRIRGQRCSDVHLFLLFYTLNLRVFSQIDSQSGNSLIRIKILRI